MTTKTTARRLRTLAKNLKRVTYRADFGRTWALHFNVSEVREFGVNRSAK